jgi:tetratricopeptide (TPR) repeat protein
MSRVADAFLRSGLSEAQVRRQYAQSLLDQGNVYPALAMLHDLLSEHDVSKRERAEARGLIGRAYKQIYTDADDVRPRHNKDALRKAIAAYHDVYEEDPDEYWHGVNAVALLARAHRDGIEINADLDYQQIAKSIVENLGEDDARNATMWDLATLAEASLALGKWDDAAMYLNRYLGQDADAFELASTLRQFEDVWKLDSDETEERGLIDLLRSRLLQRSGGEVRTTAGNISKLIAKANDAADGLEKILGTTGYQSYQWLLLAMQNALCVGRIWQGGRGIGTGFLLPGDALSPAWAEKQIFVTNNHVISKPLGHAIAILPEQARITFDVLHGSDAKRYAVEEEPLWQSPVAKCDTTVLILNETVEGLDDFTLASSMPTNKKEDRIYVIGHPKGGELSFSFQDNTLIDFDDRRLHYRSPTEPGSSGSPIFNEQWELIGLHHAGHNQMPKISGDGSYPANEGITIPAIKKAIANP